MWVRIQFENPFTALKSVLHVDKQIKLTEINPDMSQKYDLYTEISQTPQRQGKGLGGVVAYGRNLPVVCCISRVQSSTRNQHWRLWMPLDSHSAHCALRQPSCQTEAWRARTI